MFVEIVPSSNVRPRMQEITILLQARAKVFAEVERSTDADERDAHFARWRGITKQIETLQALPIR